MKQPKLRPVHKQDLYELFRNFNVKYGDLEIFIPKGFRYDGASVPKGVWALTYSPFNPRVMLAALVHDYLYREGLVDRKLADQTFYDLLIANGCNNIKAKMMYQAVRSFGGSHYK